MTILPLDVYESWYAAWPTFAVSCHALWIMSQVRGSFYELTTPDAGARQPSSGQSAPHRRTRCELLSGSTHRWCESPRGVRRSGRGFEGLDILRNRLGHAGIVRVLLDLADNGASHHGTIGKRRDA